MKKETRIAYNAAKCRNSTCLPYIIIVQYRFFKNDDGVSGDMLVVHIFLWNVLIKSRILYKSNVVFEYDKVKYLISISLSHTELEKWTFDCLNAINAM